MCRVHPQDPGLLREFDRLGLTPGTELQVLDIREDTNAVLLRISGSSGPAALDKSTATHIYVDIK